MVENGGRLLLLCLLTFFIIQVIFSANKLWEEKTAVSTIKQYDQSRLMPSVSFCFYYEKVGGGDGSLTARMVAEATLKDARRV